MAWRAVYHGARVRPNLRLTPPRMWSSSSERAPHAATKKTAENTPPATRPRASGASRSLANAQAHAPAIADANTVRITELTSSRARIVPRRIFNPTNKSTICTNDEPATAALIPACPIGPFKTTASAINTSRSMALTMTGVRVSPSAWNTGTSCRTAARVQMAPPCQTSERAVSIDACASNWPR